MEDNNKKSGKGKMIAIIAIIVVIGAVVLFFVMGAIKRSHEGPGQQGPGQGPGQRPGRDSGAITTVYEVAVEDYYIAA